MAERGGYQKPKGPRPKGGPGKMSQREDANRPPKLDHPDMQYGDVSELEQSLQAAPLPQGAASQSPRPPSSSPVGAGGGIPSDAFDVLTRNPNEPSTAGLDIGAGDDSSILQTRPTPTNPREQVLEWVARNFGNADAARMLQDIRQSAMIDTGGGPVGRGPLERPATDEDVLPDASGLGDDSGGGAPDPGDISDDEGLLLGDEEEDFEDDEDLDDPEGEADPDLDEEVAEPVAEEPDAELGV